MIPFHFAYYKPDTWEEAINLCKDLNFQGKNPMYYSGGTEIISLATMNEISPQAVIDVKGISECNVLKAENNYLTIGSAATLTQIFESNLFPLLGKTCSRIADHTIQGKITLGGNLAGTIIYHEAVLPLLLSDSQIVIAGKYGFRSVPIYEVFNQKIKLLPEEFLVQIVTEYSYINSPYYHDKITTYEKIDYPLVTLTALKKDNRIRVAFAGLCDFPFRSLKIEDEINNKNLSLENRITNVLHNLPGPIIDDIHGSREYRGFVLSHALTKAITKLEEVG